MLKIVYKDLSTKQFCLKNHVRENSFYEMWFWCSKHVPKKKVRILSTENERFEVIFGELLLVEVI